MNIIFCTEYSDHYASAIRLYASGYLLKQVISEDIINEILNILNDIHTIYKIKIEIYVKTFGHFEIFYKDKSIYFEREKLKEILAYLIDRHGSSVTRCDICAILFENKNAP